MEPAITTNLGERTSDFVIARLAALFLIVFITVLAYLNYAWPTRLFSDDAFFYLCVGRNLATGQGSTFGGIVPTNGYHPLWQYCNAAFYLIGDDDLLAIRLAALSDVVLVAIAGGFIWRLASLYMPVSWAAVAPVMLLFAAALNSFGLETWLYVVLVLVLLTWTARGRLVSPRTAWYKHVLVGLLCGAIILARLDSIVTVWAWFLLVGWARWRRHGIGNALRGAVIEGAAVTCLVLPYLIGNRLAFGHFATISASLKTCFPHPSLPGLAPWFVMRTAPGVLLGLLFLCRPRLWSGPNPASDSGHVRLALQVGAVGMLAHTIMIYLFSNYEPYLASYWIDAMLMCAVLLPGLVASWFSRRWAVRPARPRISGAIVLIGLLLVAMAGDGLKLALRFRTAGPYFAASQALGRWYAETFPPDAVIFQRDLVGEPTFWSRRHVIDGCGLMNNHEYQDALLNHRVVEYLRDHAVTHVVWSGIEDLPGAVAILDRSYPKILYPVVTFQRGRVCGENEFVLRRQWELGRYFRRVSNTRSSPFTYCAWKLPEHWTATELRADNGTGVSGVR